MGSGSNHGGKTLTLHGSALKVAMGSDIKTLLAALSLVVGLAMGAPFVRTSRAQSDPGTFCVQGVVFYDVNEDGIQNDPSAEPALPGFQVKIFLDRNADRQLDPDDAPPVETLVTEARMYHSVELEAGTYFVTAEPPMADSPWIRTLPQGPVMLTFAGVGGDFCDEVNFGFKRSPASPLDGRRVFLPLVVR